MFLPNDILIKIANYLKYDKDNGMIFINKYVYAISKIKIKYISKIQKFIKGCHYSLINQPLICDPFITKKLYKRIYENNIKDYLNIYIIDFYIDKLSIYNKINDEQIQLLNNLKNNFNSKYVRRNSREICNILSVDQMELIGI
tara:strand:+ start:64 stop:492 length:429 start_codon:yes stop_codon:yes gene_type:complete